MTKDELRRLCTEQRKAVNNKSELDKAVYENFISLDCYKFAGTVLCYMSLNNETDTKLIVKRILSDGKKLALPRCVDDKGNMKFYTVNSLDEVKTGSFGILEPDTVLCSELNDFSDSIIIVPGLCFDKNGYRLGYGKGYYDRFLKNYPFISVGLCYNSFIKKEIPRNDYDVSLDIIVTDTKVIYVNSGGKNG